MDELLREMQSKGLAHCSRSWIMRAIEQKNPHLTLDLATSAPYPTLSTLDRALHTKPEWLDIPKEAN